MAIEVTSSFDVKTNLPLDAKYIQATTTTRNAIGAGERFEGLTVYVVADAKSYQLQGGILNSNWVSLAASATFYLHSSATGLTAFAGGGQSSALQLAAEFNRVTTVATSGDSVKLPAGVAGMQVFVQNDGANSLDVFPATGEGIDILGTNVAYAISISKKNAQFNCVATGVWRAQAGGGGAGGIIAVTDATARDAILTADRYQGLLVYLSTPKITYQLQGGITNSDWVLLDLHIFVSTVQSFTGAGAATLAAVRRQRIKIKASSPGLATVTFPNGTIDGQELYVQGDDNDAYCVIADGGNVFQNGDVNYFKYTLKHFIWDAANTMWVIQGAG